MLINKDKYKVLEKKVTRKCSSNNSSLITRQLYCDKRSMNSVMHIGARSLSKRMLLMTRHTKFSNVMSHHSAFGFPMPDNPTQHCLYSFKLQDLNVKNGVPENFNTVLFMRISNNFSLKLDLLEMSDVFLINLLCTSSNIEEWLIGYVNTE